MEVGGLIIPSSSKKKKSPESQVAKKGDRPKGVPGDSFMHFSHGERTSGRLPEKIYGRKEAKDSSSKLDRIAQKQKRKRRKYPSQDKAVEKTSFAQMIPTTPLSTKCELPSPSPSPRTNILSPEMSFLPDKAGLVETTVPQSSHYSILHICEEQFEPIAKIQHTRVRCPMQFEPVRDDLDRPIHQFGMLTRLEA